MGYFRPLDPKKVWEYITRTLTGFTGTPRSNLVGADEPIYTRLDKKITDHETAISNKITSHDSDIKDRLGDPTADATTIYDFVKAQLDAKVSSRMSNQYESKLPKLDNLDVAVSTRSNHSPADVRNELETNLGLTSSRVSKLDNLDVKISTRSSHTPADVWSYSNRTLTQSKFPFWSAIITPSHILNTDLPTDSIGYQTVQPPSGETWFIFALGGCNSNGHSGMQLAWEFYDGTTEYFIARAHPWHADAVSETLFAGIITNEMYLRQYVRNITGYASNDYYLGYSGFKLSERFSKPKKINNLKIPPFKRKTQFDIPKSPIDLTPLEKYICDIYDHERKAYVQAIILEEDTPLAVDPKTNFPVERFSCYVYVENLLKILDQIKIDPVRTGYKKYLDKWKAEGITI